MKHAARSSAKLVTEADVAAMLRSQLDSDPRAKSALAARLGVRERQLTNILRSGRGIVPEVAEALGYRKVVRFERVE